MFNVGALGGTSLSFDDHGHATKITIQRHGKTLALVDRLDARITKSKRPRTVFPPEDFPQAESFALESCGRGCVQVLTGGQRSWKVYQSSADAREACLSWVRVSYSLEAPTAWRLTLAECLATVQQGDGYITIQCADHTALRVSSAQPLAYETLSEKGKITGVAVTVQLPQGDSSVEMVVESRPRYNLADTVILCMPQQLGEAAVLATCVRGKVANQGKYVPVIDVSNPPFDPSEFMAANKALQEKAQEWQGVQQELMRLAQATPAPAIQGLILPGGGAPRSEEKIKELAKRQDTLQQEVSEHQAKVLTFATWQRRWERVLRLLSAIQPAQVVCLYPVPPDLLAAISPATPRLFYFWEDFRAHVSEWEKVLAEKSEGQPPSPVYFGDLEQLAKLAWERLSARPYEGAFTIPDDPRYFALGVRRALELGKPLLPKGRAGDKVSLEQATELANQGATADEAVVVEADGSLASLAAALYADFRNAPLFVHPAANPQDVVRKLASIQQKIENEELAKQSSTAYAYLGEHKARFIQDAKVSQEMRNLAASIPVIELPRAMPTPYSPQVFVQMMVSYTTAKQQGLETGYRYDRATWEKDTQELTAIVTARVDGLVRAKMLKRQRATVFTVGMPYTFVDGWRDKTVGLILAEPCLTVLRHVMTGALTPPPAAFTAVFDAGVLRQVESPEVRRRLRHGRTYPLVLRELAANAAALQTYSALLPVEGIFLDTLGDEGSIMFADARRGMKPMSAAEIGLTLDLAHGPLVFSHIAFSWLSVGAAFMSAGARGYVGTLWSVESEPAHEMALRELGTLEQNGDVDDMTRRAYVHLGLVGPVATPEADATLAQASVSGSILPNEAARESLLSAMLYLAEAGLYEQAEPLFRNWEALCQEDLAAAGDEAGFLKEDMDAQEREYHKREQAGRERRAAGAAQGLPGEPMSDSGVGAEAPGQGPVAGGILDLGGH
ncbi:MAG: hypothetical protein Q8O07_01990 [Chloroflexota bacterium]|nr:hypothetical protein [Chloroflexota bacterium]